MAVRSDAGVALPVIAPGLKRALCRECSRAKHAAVVAHEDLARRSLVIMEMFVTDDGGLDHAAVGLRQPHDSGFGRNCQNHHGSEQEAVEECS